MYPLKKQPRRFVFGALDRIVIRNREYRWVSTDEFGHVLSPVLGPGEPISEGFSHEDLDTLAEKGVLQHDLHYYDEARALTRLRNGGAISLFDLPPSEQKQLLQRQEILELIRQEEVTDPSFVRTDGHLKKVLPRITATLVERNQARAAEGKTERCDQHFTMSKIPSTRTIRRWWKAYERSGFDIMSLRDGHHRSGNPYSSLHPDVLQLIDKHAAGYCDRRRPTMAAQYDALGAEIRRINEGRPDNAKLSVPAKGTFRKAIKAIPVFDAYAGRHGLDAAKRKFAVVGRGMESVRAFQPLVMDGHKTQISTIAVRISKWGALSPEEKRKAERERLILHLSLCAAVRRHATQGRMRRVVVAIHDIPDERRPDAFGKYARLRSRVVVTLLLDAAERPAGEVRQETTVHGAEDAFAVTSHLGEADRSGLERGAQIGDAAAEFGRNPRAARVGMDRSGTGGHRPVAVALRGGRVPALVCHTHAQQRLCRLLVLGFSEADARDAARRALRRSAPART